MDNYIKLTERLGFKRSLSLGKNKHILEKVKKAISANALRIEQVNDFTVLYEDFTVEGISPHNVYHLSIDNESCWDAQFIHLTIGHTSLSDPCNHHFRDCFNVDIMNRECDGETTILEHQSFPDREGALAFADNLLTGLKNGTFTTLSRPSLNVGLKALEDEINMLVENDETDYGHD